VRLPFFFLSLRAGRGEESFSVAALLYVDRDFPVLLAGSVTGSTQTSFFDSLPVQIGFQLSFVVFTSGNSFLSLLAIAVGLPPPCVTIAVNHTSLALPPSTLFFHLARDF